jgi:hypothetical protein
MPGTFLRLACGGGIRGRVRDAQNRGGKSDPFSSCPSREENGLSTADLVNDMCVGVWAWVSDTGGCVMFVFLAVRNESSKARCTALSLIQPGRLGKLESEGAGDEGVSIVYAERCSVFQPVRMSAAPPHGLHAASTMAASHAARPIGRDGLCAAAEAGHRMVPQYGQLAQWALLGQ